MTPRETEALMTELGTEIREYVNNVVAPLKQQFEEIVSGAELKSYGRKFQERLGIEIARNIKTYTAAQLAPLLEKIESLERRVVGIEQRGLLFKGAYQRAMSYQTGDAVTDAGGLWIALKSVSPCEAPGASRSWQLCTKSAAKELR